MLPVRMRPFVVALLLAAGCASSGAHNMKAGYPGPFNPSGGSGTVTTSGPVSGDGSSGTPVTISSGAVALGKLATQADQTLLCNISGGAASPTACTAAQGQTLLAVPTPIDPKSVALSRARQLLGSTITTCLGTDFDNDQWHACAGSSGTCTPSTTDVAGVVTLDSTGTSGRNAVIKQHGTGPSYVVNASTTRWYAVYRFKVPTAMTAQSQAAPELRGAGTGGSPIIGFGVYGAISSSFFAWRSLNVAVATLASGTTSTAIDNAWHTVEIYNDTTNLKFGLDLGSSTTATASTASSNVDGTAAESLGAVVSNGTDNVSRQLSIDYMYYCIAGN